MTHQALALLLLLSFGAGIAHAGPLCPHDGRAVARWRFTDAAAPTSTVILVPGLNNAPTSFGDLAALMLQNGHHVLEVALAGQAPDARPVSIDQWVCDLRSAAEHAERSAPGVPLTILGFSLGGTVAVEALDRTPELRPHRIALLAPAIALRTKAYLLRPFLGLRIFGISLPSLTPEPFRYAPRTPLAAYAALFRAIDDTTEMKNTERLGRIPGIVLLHESDELISASRLRAWLEANGLPWKLDVISPENRIEAPYHLIADLTRLRAAGRAQQLISFLRVPADGRPNTLSALGQGSESRAVSSPR